jgi:neutral ceramidase
MSDASRTTRFALLGVAVLALLPGMTRGNELRAGTAKVNLPIREGVQLAGFRDDRVASGTHDPLQARILLLRTATESMAIVACDLYSFTSRRVSEEARRAFNVGTVLFAASGTHSAPGVDSRLGQAWLSGVEDAILDGLRQAASAMFAARLGAGAGTADLAYNLRLVDEQGAVKTLWHNLEHKPTGPLWPTVPVWRIETDTGDLRALLYGVACRASILGKDNRELSAEYPGFASRRIESILGGRTMAIFLQGASGNLAPSANESSFERMEQIGEQVAQEVVRVSRTIAPQAELKPSLEVYRTNFSFRERWGSRQPLLIESATVVINRNYALAAFPGAPFVEHQIGLADRSPAGHTLLTAHTQTGNGEWAGILPTLRAAAEGGYGASYATRLEVGAGEAMLDAALVNIYRALGKLDDLPRGTLVIEMPPEGRPRR